ncbi:unnamed protein product [Alternaria alternata]|jgi:hypothetical protein|uniref:Uncharacterized protein n=1 Tax=Alternaria tenuissima TaxID=119927 RepID=A0AB37W726_9PLEO|nr:hypothetical protein AA0115_g10273 [Alternaria tenuissima]RYN56141.1 hypothetical protein AA0118_g8325 [Alternaria tenuissima]
MGISSYPVGHYASNSTAHWCIANAISGRVRVVLRNDAYKGRRLAAYAFGSRIFISSASKPLIDKLITKIPFSQTSNTPKMAGSSSLMLYRPGPSNSLSTRSYSTSLISSRLFSQQTGTAIATELLYRVLIDIINRFLCSFQRLASRGIDEASLWMERKLQERRDNLNAAKANAREGLKIVEEVGKLVEHRGFVTCPMTGHAMDATAEGKRELPGPPQWIRGVLAGIDEGRMVERDFWIHTHTG